VFVTSAFHTGDTVGGATSAPLRLCVKRGRQRTVTSA